jgi:membrane peptidoglycan carboxypeptidase
VYGVEAAALLYFDMSAVDLDLAEASMITGIFRAPSRYFP